MQGLLDLDRRITVVVSANFLAIAARMSLVQFLGIYYSHHVGIDVAVVGLGFLFESLARGLLAPMFGALSDRIGRRALLLASALSTAVILPCFLMVDGPASLVLWSLTLGITGAVNMPVASALLLDLAPPDRRQSVLALNYTGMSVAYTLGVVPAGYVAEQGYGFLAIGSAAGYILVALLYALALRGPLPAEKTAGESNFARDTVSVFFDPRFALFAGIAFVFPLSMGMLVTVTPLYGADVGLREGYIGAVLGANSILVAVLALPVATRIEAQGPFRFLGLAAAIIAAALASFALIPGAAAAFLTGTIVYSFGEVIFSSAVPAAVARLAPAGRRGAYQGGWTLVASLAMGSALVVSGLISKVAGWHAAWLLGAALTLVAAALLFALRERFQKA
ncbi:MAG TPA: MFS transporter [Burkholderiales bacterium]|nr:MFS transporter [Burkholderiales bacterium]